MTRMIYLGAVIVAALGMASSEAFGQTNGSLSSTAGIAQIGASSSLVGNTLGFTLHLAGKDVIYLWEGSNVYPVATRTTNSSVVISPYSPHNRVIVDGIRSGELVMDPSVMKAFIRP
jgi:hypothetical protein